MECLEVLEQHVRQLLVLNQQLKQANAELRADNERQREEIMRTHTELVTLQQAHKRLRMAQGLANDPEQRVIAKRHLNAIIAQIDRAMEVLKQ